MSKPLECPHCHTPLEFSSYTRLVIPRKKRVPIQPVDGDPQAVPVDQSGGFPVAASDAS